MPARHRWSIIAITGLAIVAGLAAVLLMRNDAPRATVTDVPAPTSAVTPGETPEPVVRDEVNAPEAEPVEPESLATPAVQHPTGEGRVHGTVAFPPGASRGLPVTVSAHWVNLDSAMPEYSDVPPAQTQADVAGAFEITGLAWGSYVIFADAPGYTINNSASLSKQRPEENYTLTLVPGGAIAGKVVNEVGDPVAGARVFNAGWDIGGQVRAAPLNRSLASQSITDETGAFQVAHLRLSLSGEPGYQLAVKAEGYATLLTEYMKAGTSGIELTVMSGIAVAGQLILNDTGEPVPDKELRFTRNEVAVEQTVARTDAEGFFFLSDLSPGPKNAELVDDELVLTFESAHVEITPESPENELVLRAATGGRIAGRVYEETSGDGLGNVTLRCRMDAPGGRLRTTLTRSDGTYILAGLKPGSYDVFLEKPKGFVQTDRGSDERTAVVKIAAATDGIDFPVVRGLRISGRALTSEGEPLASVGINAHDTETGSGDYMSTESDGNFVLAGYNANSTVRLQANHDDAALLQIEPSGQELKLAASDISGVKFIFGAGGSISGVVVDTDGRPQAGVELRAQPEEGKGLSGATATSKSDGAITFAHVGPGEYTIYHVMEGRYNSWSAIDTAVTMPKEGDLTGRKFVIAAKGGLSISGRVADTSGRPIPGAGITLNGDRVAARSDANGLYTVADLNNRVYWFLATAPGFTPSEQVSAYAGDTGVDFVLHGVATIEGQVLSAQSGEPVTQYKIRARTVRSIYYYEQGGTYTGVVDANGRFKLSNVQNGVTTIDLQAEGFGSTSVTIPTVAGGETRQGVVLRINAEAELSGSVVNLAGKPVAKAGVAVYGETAPWNPNEGIETGEDGSFLIKSLSPGPINVYIEHKEYPPKVTSVTVAAGAQNQVNVVLSNGGSIEGTISLNGKPVENQSVHASAMNVQTSRNAKSDARGYYRLDGLPTGSIQVNPSLSLPGVPFRGKTAHVDVQDGSVTQANFNFTLGTGVIEGTIYAKPGSVVPGSVSIMAHAITAAGTRDYFSFEATDGKYRIENVPAGDIAIRASSETYGEKRALVSLTEGQRVRKDIVFSAGSMLYVDVAWDEADGDWVQVYVLPEPVDIPAQLSEPFMDDLWQSSAGQSSVIRGRARIGGLEAGTYTVLVVRQHPQPPGEENDRHLDAQREVRVVDVDGEQDLTIAVSV